MSEMVIEFNDIQKTSPQKPLKARGILNDCANIQMIDGEKNAWEKAAIEKYATIST